jgi:hypothetical protein
VEELIEIWGVVDNERSFVLSKRVDISFKSVDVCSNRLVLLETDWAMDQLTSLSRFRNDPSDSDSNNGNGRGCISLEKAHEYRLN